MPIAKKQTHAGIVTYPDGQRGILVAGKENLHLIFHYKCLKRALNALG